MRSDIHVGRRALVIGPSCLPTVVAGSPAAPTTADVPAALDIYQGPGKARFADAGLDLQLVRVPIGTADMTPQLEKVVSGHPTAPIGDAKATQLYEAVVGEYGQGIDTSRSAGHIMFSTLAGFALALEGMHGDVTPATIISTMKAMPDEELPNGAGLHFRCDGKANPATPAVCTRGVLLATLDGTGNPSGYKPTSTAPIG